MNNSFYQELFELTSRDKKDLLATYVKLGEEHGELAREVLAFANEPGVVHRYSTHQNIIEECIDVSLVALSLAVKAGCTEDQLNDMLRNKMDKWGNILNNEGRMKDIKNIPFEIHCTFEFSGNISDIAGIQEICKDIGVKMIMLDLENSKGLIIKDPMTTSKFFGTNSQAIEETYRIEEELERAGYKCLRRKIETVPWHPLAPQSDKDIMPNGCYFECHIGVHIDKTSNQPELLKNICHGHNAHLSKNAFKSNGDNIVQMVTLRVYTNRLDMDQQLSQLLTVLEKYSFEYEKVITEFALFDSKIHHDAEWMK